MRCEGLHCPRRPVYFQRNPPFLLSVRHPCLCVRSNKSGTERSELNSVLVVVALTTLQILPLANFLCICLTERKESLFCKRTLCPTRRCNLLRADSAERLTVRVKEGVGSKQTWAM